VLVGVLAPVLVGVVVPVPVLGLVPALVPVPVLAAVLVPAGALELPATAALGSTCALSLGASLQAASATTKKAAFLIPLKIARTMSRGGAMKESLRAVAALGLLACGSSESTTFKPDDGGVTSPDASLSHRDAGVDNGEASTTYPAYRPPVPQIVLNPGGSALVAPRVRAIYFPGDLLRAPLDAAMAQYIASTAWLAQTSEYGVSAAKWSSAVAGDSAPTLIDAEGIKLWLRSKLVDGPAPDPAFGPTDAATLASTMFVLFYPNGTEITRTDGSSCATFDAFHDETQVAGAAIAFTVVARC
jgi:hypothetical protein